jgi:hypothetical protein
LSDFIIHTRAVGGVVVRLTLCLDNFSFVFREDNDAEFVISCVAYGVDMNYTPPEDTAFFRVGNYVSDEHAPKVTAQIPNGGPRGPHCQNDN